MSPIAPDRSCPRTLARPVASSSPIYPESILEPILTRLRTEDVDVPALCNELDQIRERGYALNFRPDNVVSIATPVRDRNDVTIAAINAVGPADRMAPRDRLRVARQLHAAAAQLEEVLRAAPPD